LGVSIGLFLLFAFSRKNIGEAYDILEQLRIRLHMPNDENAHRRRIICWVSISAMLAAALAASAALVVSIVCKAYMDKMLADADPPFYALIGLGLYSCTVFMGTFNPLMVGAIILFVDLGYAWGRVLHAWHCEQRALAVPGPVIPQQ
jgi:hypothetical protein